MAILALSALVGLRFLTGGMRVLNEHGLLSPPAPAVPTGAVPAGAVPTGAVPAGAVPAGAPVAAPVAVPAVPVGAAANGALAAPVPAPVSVAGEAAPAPRPQWDPSGIPVPPGYVLYPATATALAPPHRPTRGRPTPASTPPSMTLLYIWIMLFGFVGTQLAWTLRPFFGSPGMKFSLYRDIDGNFYAEIMRTLAHLF